MSAAARVILAACVCTAASFTTQRGANATTTNWFQWRGPANTGVAPGDAPLTWSDTSNVAWKIAIPGRGFSSPVIWGDRLFLTTAVPTGDSAATSSSPGGRGPGGGAGAGQPHQFEVMAIDRASGKIVWRQTAATSTPHEGYHQTYGSFASNSPATDGARVYAFFGSRGLFAYDMDGKPIWKKDFGVQMRMLLQFGEGSAIVCHDGRLLVLYDHTGESFLASLDAATGRELWRTPRTEGSNWSAPFVATHDGTRQVVVTASTKVKSYDFETGRLIWEVAGLGANTIPQPVQSGDVVYVMSGYRNPKLMAIRLGRTGDLTGTDAVVWQATRGLSYTPSPVVHDNILYVLTDSGQLSAFDAVTGQPYYQQARLPQPYNFKASPIAAGGKLYLASEEGDVVVVKMGRAFEVLATNTLSDQSFIATPAWADGELYLRSRTHLFRIAAH